jgi:hypothetical protein
MSLNHISAILLLITLFSTNTGFLFWPLSLALIFFQILSLSFLLFIKRIALFIPLFILLILIQPHNFSLTVLKIVTSILLLAIISNNFNITTIKKFLTDIRCSEKNQELILIGLCHLYVFSDELKNVFCALQLRGNQERKKLKNIHNLKKLLKIFFSRTIINSRSKSLYNTVKLRGF